MKSALKKRYQKIFYFSEESSCDDIFESSRGGNNIKSLFKFHYDDLATPRFYGENLFRHEVLRKIEANYTTNERENEAPKVDKVKVSNCINTEK